jgi:hypothetical protein
MKKEEAVAFIIQELGKHNSKNEIIRILCERTGMPWSGAEKFMQQVEDEHSHMGVDYFRCSIFSRFCPTRCAEYDPQRAKYLC